MIIRKLLLIAISSIFLFESNNFGTTLTYASSQSTGTTGLCLGCSVSNAGNATDGNLTTYSTLNLAIGVAGSVYQNLIFPSVTSGGYYVVLCVEDPGGALLNATVLGGLAVTSYNGGVSNADTKTISGTTLQLLTGSSTKYTIEFRVTAAFDRIQLKLNGGILGAFNNLRVYYASRNIVPLPVECLFFNADVAGSSVKLTWATALENNCAHFTVQRSTDGVSYQPVQVIKAAGNSNTTNNYAIVDDEPAPGFNLYNLFETDFNGTTKMISSKAINYPVASKMAVKYSSAGQLSLNVEGVPPESTGELWLYNVVGQLVYKKSWNASSTVTCPVPPSGLYFLEVAYKETLLSKQIIIP